MNSYEVKKEETANGNYELFQSWIWIVFWLRYFIFQNIKIISFSLNLYFSLIEHSTVSLKGMTGRSHSKALGHWLDVQVEIREKHPSSGLTLGPALPIIFVGSMDSGRTSTANLPGMPSWMVWLALQRKGILSTGTLAALRDRLVWTSWCSTKSRTRFCMWTGEIPRTAAGWVSTTDLEQLWGEGLGCVGSWEAQHEPAMCSCFSESQTHPGLHQRWHGQGVEGGDSVPVLHSGETTPVILLPLLSPTI